MLQNQHRYFAPYFYKLSKKLFEQLKFQSYKSWKSGQFQGVKENIKSSKVKYGNSSEIGEVINTEEGKLLKNFG